MDRRIALLGIFFVMLSLLTAGCLVPPNSGNATVQNLTFRIGMGTNPVLGSDGAAIAIVEFTDYQCPYCRQHATETFPQIEQNYVNTGRVKYYLRDFPLEFHPNSRNGATAARCAGDQGKYWEMHSLLFQKQDEWSGLSGSDLVAKFSSYADSLGLNTAQYNSCYSAGKAGAISADIADGQEYGIAGTPSSIIILPRTANETRLLGILAAYPQYASQGILALGKDPDGKYVFFIKGAFPYQIFQQALDSS